MAKEIVALRGFEGVDDLTDAPPEVVDATLCGPSEESLEREKANSMGLRSGD
jgi:hypothetical protein